MIRLRDAKGNIIPMPKAAMFVELLDADGNLAASFYDDTTDGGVVVVSKGSPRARNYQTLYGVEFVEIVDDSARELVRKGG